MASQGSQSNGSNVCFLRYFDGIFVVTKKEMLRVFFWLYQGGSQYVGDYLADFPSDIKRSLRLGSMEKKALERKDSPVKFDIPMLYTLCQFTCGLADHKEPIWNKPTNDQEEQSLEHSLYLLKEKRNKLCHEPQTLMKMTTEDLDIHFDELSRLCGIILHKGGERAGRPTREVDEFASRMRKGFDDIKTKPAPSGMTTKIFGLTGRSEMRQNHTPSPVDGNFVFPSLQNKGEDGSYRRNLQDFPLWQCGSGSNPETIVLSGETGTGKTAICGHIYDSWIFNKRDISQLDEFDLVIPVHCSSVSTCDVLDFLRRFIYVTHSLCARDEISAFLKSLRILWLFDGFEEATKDAIELLKQITQYQGASTLVFITTLPQRLQDLINKKLTTIETTIVTQLLGFSDDGVECFLKKVLSGRERDFFRDVKDLGEDLLQELRVPLKLKLMAELWKDGKLRKESGSSVYFLHKSIMEAHMEKIKEKIKTETKLDDEDIKNRVHSWVNILCKTAFDMIISNQLVKINREYQEQLEKAAQCLIYPKDCLSVYLQSETVNNSNSYSFIHGTQQIYLAAQYIYCMIHSEGIFPQELKQLSNVGPSFRRRQSDYILHSMLLQVVNRVAEQKSVKGNIVKDLVQLLSTFSSDFNAFEVIRHAAFDPTFTEEVSKYSGQTWMTFDHDIKAAVAIFQYTTPALIRIFIGKDPNEVQKLTLFLQLISKRDLDLQLSLLPHVFISDISDSSDNYLRDICSADVKCHLRLFGGCFSIDSAKNITKMREIKAMSLKVTLNEILHEIFINLKFLQNLEYLTLTLMMPIVTVPSPCSFTARINSLTIELPFMDESKLKETADALSSISKHYESITLHNILASSAAQFIQRLQQNNVTVNEIIRKMFCHPFDLSEFFVINFGSVPLIQPIEVFFHQWQNTHVETYEDDLGIRRLGLLTKGISQENVVYVESKSPTNPKIMVYPYIPQ